MQENNFKKLKELNALPNGIYFNDAFVWNNIEQQLPQKNNKKKYWLPIIWAAAILLIIFGIYTLPTTKNSAVEKNDFTTSTKSKNYNKHVLPAFSNNINKTVKLQNKENIWLANKVLDANKNKIQTTILSDVVDTLNNGITIAEAPVNVFVKDSVVAITNTVKAVNSLQAKTNKKSNKYAVVHINEINAPKHVDFVFEKTDFQLPNFMENANNTIVPESKSILFIKLKQTATAIQQ